MWKLWKAWVTITILLLCIAAMMALSHLEDLDARSHEVECQEDDPCWDCRTMGNGLCDAGNRTMIEPGETSVDIPPTVIERGEQQWKC